MRTADQSSFEVGGFRVWPDRGLILINGNEVHLEPKVMAVLVRLASNAGDVVSKDTLLETVWADSFVTEHVLKVAVSELRKALGDSAKDPRFIQTIPKQGYRLIANVSGVEENSTPSPELPASAPVKKPAHTVWLFYIPATALLLIILVTAWKLAERQTDLPGRVATEQIGSVAVLPLRNLADDPSEEYFTEGITEAITAELARIPGLRVISPTSARRYKDAKKTAPEIARELGVEAIVEGSVLRSGGRVRVIIQLTDGAAGEHLWDEKYERDLKDVIALQNELAAAVAARIGDLLTAGQQPRTSVGPEAYEAFLKGRYLWNKGDRESLLKSTEYFERAIELEPGYGEAYAGLADGYNFIGVGGDVPIFQKAGAAARRALELNGQLSEAHAALGFTLMYGEWKWAEAEQAYLRAIQLNPGRAINYHWIASLFSVTGRHTQAVRAAQQAQSLDPVSPSVNGDLAWYYYYAGRFDDAIKQARTTLELDPDAISPLMCLHLSFHLKGLPDESVAELERLVEQKRYGCLSRDSLRRAYRAGGETAAWRALVACLEGDARSEKPPTYQLAVAHAFLGNQERALFWIAKAVDSREAWVPFLAFDPCFHTLQPTTGFQQLVSQIGITGVNPS
jgi:TolB-like protein/DNA-binding winged helix-turn-helix (wHTH) protein/Flp pilus assembly protein TadD